MAPRTLWLWWGSSVSLPTRYCCALGVSISVSSWTRQPVLQTGLVLRSSLTLTDADPRAFEVVLHFVFTDEVLGQVQMDTTDGHEESRSGAGLALLQAVGELADRLLLPRLCELLTPLMLARVDANSVVGLLLWAEARAGSFEQLLRGLAEWFQKHRDELVEREEDMTGLMAYQLCFTSCAKRQQQG